MKMHFNVHFMVPVCCLSVIQYFVGIPFQIGWIQSGTVGQSNFTMFVYSFICFESHKFVLSKNIEIGNAGILYRILHLNRLSPYSQTTHLWTSTFRMDDDLGGRECVGSIINDLKWNENSIFGLRLTRLMIINNTDHQWLQSRDAIPKSESINIRIN